MADIFISYASEDRNKAEELAETLRTRGWSIWWDRKIPLGKSYDEVIEKALGESKCAIVLWSAVSVASEWGQKRSIGSKTAWNLSTSVYRESRCAVGFQAVERS